MSMQNATVLSPPSSLAKFNDLGLAGLVVAVIVMMALPLPPWMLDILVAVNISAGIVLLLIALFVPSPLAFSTFPSVLLITTLFRISLNVATTRQILLHAHAGDIIDAFGKLVVGGSLIVGLVVFLIITVVQFIVVAKGAERVAEVGARFTLDALPGKQMSIDADMRSGVITQTEAIARRRELVQESQFYGAMDGAMKFVKGDAIAGIVIVLVNLLGGIAIGTLVMDLGFGAAVQRFSVLSIGDGLVTQIPALFVSIAAGIAITRTAPDSSANLGEQIGKQLSAQPRALLLSSGVMILFAAVPGFPTATFLILGATVATIAVVLTRRQGRQYAAQRLMAVPAAAREGDSTPVMVQRERSIGQTVSPFRLELGGALIDDMGAAALDEALRRERSSLREHHGIPFPGMVLQRVESMAPNSFSMVVQDLADTTVDLPPGAALALAAAAHPAFADIPASEEMATPVPELLTPARWVPEDTAEALRASGVEVLMPADIIARVVVRVMQKNSNAVLGVQEVRQLLREIEGRYPDLVREVQALLALPRLADLLAALMRERVPLADFTGLLQAVVTAGPGGPADPSALFEAVRMALARSIVARQLVPGETTLTVVALDPEFEARLRTSLTLRPDGPVFALPPAVAEAAQKALLAAFESDASRRVSTLVVPADLRRASSRLFRSVLPRCAWVSQEELSASAVLTQVVASVRLPAGV
jgi:type III secretion protein V